MFIPTTPEEVRQRGWEALDIILVSGDTYIDSSYNGSAVIGHFLISEGFRVGIICQPDVDSGRDILRLGTPELFWSVSAGCVETLRSDHGQRETLRASSVRAENMEEGKEGKICGEYTD